MTQVRVVPGIKFMLNHGHFFVAKMDPLRANRIVQTWMNGGYQKREASRYVGEITPQGSWCVDMDAVVGLHTVEIQEQEQDQPQYRMPPGFHGLSGFVS